ncbi:hypothetical protein AMEX_G27902 [Astyanax mexicanus]|uniref:HECT domain-containing protein n=1 Tax=Astyanax mexicanus TaxID=7994 RepID=A0A8T2KNY0_ASTMX|nr:hypothetical protein AMEX_G27902 [Astyanax mexicanus]
MLERVLSQWQRQKKSNPAKQLKVVFLGEAGIDTGALRKELLSGMMEGIEKRFFEGDRHGKRPKYSISDLDHFKTIGEIMAVSLAQGGPAPNFLAVWCYKFLCSGSLKFEDLDKTALGDDQHIELISKLFPILQQVRNGLQLYGLSDLMAKYPDICQPLFTPGVEMIADADFVMSVCRAEFSEEGSNKEHLEVTLMNHLQDLLQELEQSHYSFLTCMSIFKISSCLLHWVSWTIGEIMAVSLAQGGPAPNFLAVWCYKFLCSGSLKFEDLDKTALGDDQHIELISKVRPSE